MIQSIYLLRHGLRLDLEDKAHYRYYLKRPMDIPLSAKGMIQAKETGDWLKRERIDHIFASPFFRTLQTAQLVAERLNLEINVEYGFMEYLLPKWFETFPELLARWEAQAVFPAINKNYESLVMPDYPEVDAILLYFRVKQTIEHILRHYDGSILIVGHGAPIYAAASYLLDEPAGEDMEMSEIRKFAVHNGKWRKEWEQTGHLTYTEDFYRSEQTKEMTQSLAALRMENTREGRP